MSVLIKDMEIPKSCNDCEFIQRGYPDWCDLSCRCRDIFNPSIRPDWCPLEEAVTVKHGRWINDNGLYKCSVCNEFTITGWANCIPIEQMNKTMKYCNNCGAKMDEVEE